ncbi:hypothetical protein J8281_03770 [Aquimarina sp. U1-2]|uniref:HYC_CC_PP family protein n=1 Tax=Aquimarina sp. U1-2 TaxID=2823141 RepID=UPI001AED0583|nr:hypothetical protein [Aquimarina sp. U1-2]MBP2831296.1 hypothetical protein [Aquimarina sp. U1-2]
MKKIISILACILLLTSNSQLTYAQHFCGDSEMMALLTLGQAELSCGMVNKNDACEDNEDADHSCCDNQYTHINTDDTFQRVNHDIQLYPYIALAISYTFLLEIEPSEMSKARIPFSYISPPLHKDHQVLYETFLI